MAKTETKTIERIYTIPLRKEYSKAPIWRKTKKAVKAVKQFLIKHMKSEDVKLGKALNEKLWKHGIRNPPHKVKVSVTKDDKGVVRAELFGVKVDTPKEETKATPKGEEIVPGEASKQKDAETKPSEVKEKKSPNVKSSKSNK